MKSNYVVKTLAAAAVAVVMIVSNPLSTLANEGGSKKNSLTDEQVSVQYVGTTDNQLVFHVEFENPTAEKFWLIIRNDAGDVVYRKQFSDVHFSKSIYLQKEEDDIRPSFIIRNGANQIVRQFSISNIVTENTVVTKLQ